MITMNQHQPQLPDILAGPIMRRVTQEQLVLWLVTSRPLEISLCLYKHRDDHCFFTGSIKNFAPEPVRIVLQRMRELAVQSSNGIYNASDRKSINNEFSQLQSELDRIAGTTAFNGKNVLDGSLESGTNFQVGANSQDSINVSLSGATQEDLGTESLNVLTGENAQDAIGAIDEALASVSGVRGELGSVLNRFESTISNLGNVAENTAASESRIGDADIAAEVSNMLKNRILEQAGISIQAQANQRAGNLLSLLN